MVDFIVDTITVSSNIAPDIDISTPFDVSCINNPIDFTSVNMSGDIQFYNWDFGDGNTSTSNDPSHTFTTPGTYEVRLSVTDPDPCDNFTTKTLTIYEEPVGSFTSPAGVVCTNQVVTFNNTTPDNFEGNESFEWQIDGASVSTDRDLDYEFDSGGSFEVKLITSIPGCSNEITENFNVIAGPAPDFTVDDSCVGTLFQFNNVSTGDNIVSYSWDFDNGFMSSSETPEPFEYTSPGVYNVTLTTENASGCVTSIIKPLTVYDLPQVNFSNELSCEMELTQFEDLSSVDNANIEQWQWDFDDPASGNNTSTEQDPQHIFSTSGEFDVKLITTTTFGCKDSTEQAINVRPAPDAQFDVDRICIGEEIQFQDQSTAVPGEVLTSWAWDLGGEFSNEQNPTKTFEFAIDYNVSLTVTSQNLCSNTTNQVMSVNPAPIIDFGIEDACDNQEVNLYDLTNNNGDPVDVYNWEFAGLGTASDSSVFFDFQEAGSYTVALGIITVGGCEYSFNKPIQIQESPQASFSVGSTFGAPPFEVQFINNSSDVEEVMWDFDDGSTSIEENPVHVFEEEGTYEVKLVVRDTNGCVDTTSTIINALFPDLEVELRQLTIVNNKLILTIVNNGTLSVDSLSALVDFGNEVTVEENLDLKLESSAQPKPVNYTLDLNLATRNVDFVCVTINSHLAGIEDSNASNNTTCETFERPVVFVTPFPNPATNKLNLRVVSEANGEMIVRLFNNLGVQVIEDSIDGV
ncbi:PKD domain-containing protein, partial [Fulvivirga aurantia]|uniref:PKD domain-containing protein n=1 Tax=Fulvivirga aurantia TaxID=2529383 RepID=UPI0031B59FCE